MTCFTLHSTLKYYSHETEADNSQGDDDKMKDNGRDQHTEEEEVVCNTVQDHLRVMGFSLPTLQQSQ